jgi:very-short-patch-repair endonuclease
MSKDYSRIRGTTHEIEQAARRLRQALTPAEVKLWSALRRRQLAGLKFRCQHPVGQFILDFYCPTCKLVVEVDGKIHEQQTEYDQARTHYLQAYGYRILRFSNQQVFSDLEAVLDEIKAVAEASVDVRNYPEISEPQD